MSHEPGRERHIIYTCEKCGGKQPDQLKYNDWQDQYWCESCFSNEAEAAYDRWQEANRASTREATREEQLRTWEEHQKAHKR